MEKISDRINYFIYFFVLVMCSFVLKNRNPHLDRELKFRLVMLSYLLYNSIKKSDAVHYSTIVSILAYWQRRLI